MSRRNTHLRRLPIAASELLEMLQKPMLRIGSGRRRQDLPDARGETIPKAWQQEDRRLMAKLCPLTWREFLVLSVAL
jgi:hypothetical protein